MLKIAVRQGALVGASGTCRDARGIGAEEIVDAVRRSSMDELAEWTRRADKVIVF